MENLRRRAGDLARFGNGEPGHPADAGRPDDGGQTSCDERGDLAVQQQFADTSAPTPSTRDIGIGAIDGPEMEVRTRSGEIQMTAAQVVDRILAGIIDPAYQSRRQLETQQAAGPRHGKRDAKTGWAVRRRAHDPDPLALPPDASTPRKGPAASRLDTHAGKPLQQVVDPPVVGAASDRGQGQTEDPGKKRDRQIAEGAKSESDSPRAAELGALLVGAIGRSLQERLLATKHVDGVPNVREGPRGSGLDARQQIHPDPVPEAASVGVRGVDDERETQPIEVRQELALPEVDERAHEGSSPRRNGPQPPAAASAKQFHEEGLDHIVERVAESDAMAVQPRCSIPKK